MNSASFVRSVLYPSPRIQIRRRSYRGRDGWLICGTDPYMRRVSIFTETRTSAETIRDAVKAGRETTLEMFRL
jgi:hypothetical protein